MASHTRRVLTSKAKPRILIIDDSPQHLRALIAQAEKSRAFDWGGCEPVFALFGNARPVSVEGAPNVLTFTSLNDIGAYVADARHQIRGVLTNLYKGKSDGEIAYRQEQAADLGDRRSPVSAAFVAAAENERYAYGYIVAALAHQQGVPVVIQTTLLHKDPERDAHQQRARDHGAIGLFDKDHLTLSTKQVSPISALMAAIKAQRTAGR